MDRDFKKVRVAAAQVSPAFLQRDASTEIAVQWIGKAARERAQLVAFGEAWLPAYPFWIFMGSPIYSAPFSRQLYANAVEVPSPTTDALCLAAKQNNIFVVMGLTEKSGGSLYLSQLFIGDDGRILGHRRKLKPTHWERAIWGEGDGSDFFTISTRIGNLGALNCWEHLQPLNIMAMNSFNEQIHVAGWPAFAIYNKVDPSFTNDANVSATRAYAMMTQSFAIHVSAIVNQETVDLLCGQDPDKHHLLEVGGGGSEIIGPLGNTVGRPIGPLAEGLVLGDCDFAEIASAKMSNDSSGHYQRGDTFQLLMNLAPRKPVVVHSAPASYVQSEGGPARLLRGDIKKLPVNPKTAANKAPALHQASDTR